MRAFMVHFPEGRCDGKTPHVMTGIKPMSVLAVVQHGFDISPAQRYRIEQWQPLLERDHGIRITYAPFIRRDDYKIILKPGHVTRKARAMLSGLGRRVADVSASAKVDCVYILREAAAIGPAVFERLLAARRPYIFDFDDAIFLPEVSEANRNFAFLKSHRKVESICRLATHVMAGNAYLAAWARQHNNAVTVIPTTVDTDRYLAFSRTDNDIPVIGWMGTPTTVTYLRDIRDVFVRLAETHSFRLRVVGAPDFDYLPGVDMETLPWSAQTEIDELSRFDIGVMPLRNDEWSRGKCGLKALLYMSLGKPVVCSPVGVNREIVAHGVNGLQAFTSEEWLQSFRQLLDSPDLRQRLGTAGRQTVVARYSARSQAPRVAAIFRDVASQRDPLRHRPAGKRRSP
jgi:glycosyltransferase involved in cell wall biosynthesis